MSVTVLDFASVFLNSLCFLGSGMVCAYLAMSMFFRQRHSLWPFFTVLTLKMALVSLFDALCWFGWNGDPVPFIFAAVISVLGIAMFPVNYYSWETSFVNVGLVGIIADLISGMAMSGAMFIVSAVLGLEPGLNYVGTLQASTVLVALLSVGLFFLLLQLAKPFGHYVVTHTFKHERVILFVVIMSIALTSAFRFAGPQNDLLMSFTGPIFAAFACVPVIAAYILVHLRDAKRQQAYLVRSWALMSACDEAMRSQADFLANSRGVLDGMAARIEHVENASEREGFRRYLDDIRSTCDLLRFGTYSDNPLLDTVLQHYEKSFSEAGVQVDYRVSPLDAPGEQVALAAQELLAWALRTVAPGESAGSARTVRFRAFRKANRLFLEVSVPQGSSFVPFHSWRMGKERAMFDVVHAGLVADMATVQVMLGEVAA